MIYYSVTPLHLLFRWDARNATISARTWSAASREYSVRPSRARWSSCKTRQMAAKTFSSVQKSSAEIFALRHSDGTRLSSRLRASSSKKEKNGVWFRIPADCSVKQIEQEILLRKTNWSLRKNISASAGFFFRTLRFEHAIRFLQIYPRLCLSINRIVICPHRSFLTLLSHFFKVL